MKFTEVKFSVRVGDLFLHKNEAVEDQKDWTNIYMLVDAGTSYDPDVGYTKHVVVLVNLNTGIKWGRKMLVRSAFDITRQELEQVLEHFVQVVMEL